MRLQAVRVRGAPTSSGYSLAGDLEGVPFGSVTLVVNGDVFVGTVRTSSAIYTIASESPLQVMSLLESPTGHLTNLSTRPETRGDR